MSVETICGWFGMSRQAWYQQRSRQEKREEEERRIVAQVRKLRRNHPRMGVRKLFHRLKGRLVKQGLKTGRDRLFALMRRFGLLVRVKRRRTRTTWAGAWRCENHLEKVTLTGPHQAYVSDITYIQTSAT